MKLKDLFFRREDKQREADEEINLDALFLHREDWQRNAFNRIKQNLTTARDNRFVQYDGTQDEHLVLLYGDAQVGKTTLVLTMIGIREGPCFQEVHDTLRAGIERGNSSTSTAIVYSQSENDQYGLAVGSISNGPPERFQPCNADGMVRQLKEVRSEVESNRAKAERILYIAIPRRYFTEQAARERIVIMDMPGVNSRNHKEDEHVRNLMTRYLPVASVCIIVCQYNVIQSLETLELPDGMDWRQQPHRFVLAVTRAFSAGNIKTDYFAKRQEERETGFYNHIMKLYTEEIRKILGKGNRTAVYPIDMGDSLQTLCQALTNAEDRRELLETRDKVLSDLKKWITSSRNNRLNAALNNLKDLVEYAGKDDLREIDCKADKFRKEIESAEREIKEAEQRIQWLIGDSKAAEDGSSVSQRDALQTELQKLCRNKNGLCNNGGITGLCRDLEDRLLEKGLEKGKDGTYWKDKEKIVFDALRNIALEKREKCVRELKVWADISAAARPCDIIQHCATLWEQIAPTSQGFLKRSRVYIDKLQQVCAGMEDEINRRLNQAVLRCIQNLDKEIGAKEQEIRDVENMVWGYRARIKQLRCEMGSLEKRLKEECEDERKRLERIKQTDKETLAIYRKYTEETYGDQRSRLMDQINSRQMTPAEKLMLLLFLGVLDRDYQKVTGGA